MTAIRIEKDVPIAPRVRTGGRKALYPWDQMEPGDSFLFPKTIKPSTAYSLSYRTGKVSGKQFAIRTTPDGIRCWRLAETE